MYPNPAVRQILEALQECIPSALGSNLEGIYLKGSLALGDFNPETSDVDLLVVTTEPVSEEDFPALAEMHERIQALANPYANEVELAYLPIGAIQHFQPRAEYPALERGEKLKWKPLGANWILEFWTVREHGTALYGPHPKTLIPPISLGERVGAVRRVLAQDWLEWVRTWQNPGWQTHAGEMRFVVETMCRAAYTLEHGVLCSKPQAVRWALKTLSKPWPSLIERSQSWRAGQPIDPATAHQAAEFVRWVAGLEPSL
ncbi:MAG TPA: aminoglycoside adenylyltransferase domain-containing protein [Meiothermus sp.]|jgi:predicted nucleotidyltransferase|nr:aminoglycoside adenylyltransferase domain-containing protein [Meiothermus sp.]